MSSKRKREMDSYRKIKALLANESEFSFEVETTVGFEKICSILSERCSIPKERLRVWHRGQEIFDQNAFDKVISNEMILHLTDRGRPTVESDKPIPLPHQRPVVADKFLFIWCLLANVEGETWSFKIILQTNTGS